MSFLSLLSRRKYNGTFIRLEVSERVMSSGRYAQTVKGKGG